MSFKHYEKKDGPNKKIDYNDFWSIPDDLDSLSEASTMPLDFFDDGFHFFVYNELFELDEDIFIPDYVARYEDIYDFASDIDYKMSQIKREINLLNSGQTNWRMNSPPRDYVYSPNNPVDSQNYGSNIEKAQQNYNEPNNYQIGYNDGYNDSSSENLNNDISNNQNKTPTTNTPQKKAFESKFVEKPNEVKAFVNYKSSLDDYPDYSQNKVDNNFRPTLSPLYQPQPTRSQPQTQQLSQSTKPQTQQLSQSTKPQTQQLSRGLTLHNYPPQAKITKWPQHSDDMPASPIKVHTKRETIGSVNLDVNFSLPWFSYDYTTKEIQSFENVLNYANELYSDTVADIKNFFSIVVGNNKLNIIGVGRKDLYGKFNIENFLPVNSEQLETFENSIFYIKELPSKSSLNFLKINQVATIIVALKIDKYKQSLRNKKLKNIYVECLSRGIALYVVFIN